MTLSARERFIRQKKFRAVSHLTLTGEISEIVLKKKNNLSFSVFQELRLFSSLDFGLLPSRLPKAFGVAVSLTSVHGSPQTTLRLAKLVRMDASERYSCI